MDQNVTKHELIEVLDTLIHSQPGMMERMVAQHRNNGSGLCTGCVQYQAPRLKWPCTIIKAVWSVQIRRQRPGAGTGSPGAQDGSTTPHRAVG